MDRYGFMADLVTVAADCVSNTPANNCQYEVFVANGEPPQDCSHIAVFWTGGSIIPGSDKCMVSVRETFRVSLNRCCLKNIGEEFDAVLEDDDAKCFANDFGALFECLVCNVQAALKPYIRTCQDVMVSVASPDSSPAGGCMGGMVDISFTRLQPCCS